MVLQQNISEKPHISVLYNEVLEYLAPKDDEIYVDGTFGAGGHSRGILESANCKVYGIDRDPDVLPLAQEVIDAFPGRITLLRGNYSTMDRLLKDEGIEGVHGILLDVGVSSMQLDRAERGFSFQKDAPLDMRMSQEGRDASALVNEADETELADIIYQYGGERMSRRIAKAIVKARANAPITRTVQLADIIRGAVKRYNDKIDPATRTFQAIRIWVNDELEELAQGLQAAEKLLLPGGRLLVISFHSLEDSIVKQFMKDRSGKTQSVSRYLPEEEVSSFPPSFTQTVRKAIKPGKDELAVNPRSRSARLRVAVRTDAPCWQESKGGAA